MAVDKEFVFAAVADERREIAALIDGLDDAQLATQSLCAGWDVKTVAAHLVSVFADGFWGFQAAAVRHFGINRGIDALARRRAQLPAADIAASPAGRRRPQVEPAGLRPRLGSDRRPRPRRGHPDSARPDLCAGAGPGRPSRSISSLDFVRWPSFRSAGSVASACGPTTSADPGERARNCTARQRH